MPMLVDGKWDENAGHDAIREAQYIRSDSKFRNCVTADGSRGFRAQAGRCHLYTENAKTHLHEIYSLADPHVTGRPTVPTLWDKPQQTIISNESADITRMLDRALCEVVPETVNDDPGDLRGAIDPVNTQVYETLNDNVYRTGFAKTQAAYKASVRSVFETLDALEARLSQLRYLCGDRLTEADWRLFPTLTRFDLVNYMRFKCCHKRITEYPNLWNYTLELFQHPGIADLPRLDHIKTGYYTCMPALNPPCIVPAAPHMIDYAHPHNRDRFRSAH